MNKLFAKVLTGLSATICGLALSGLFVTPVHAASATTGTWNTIHVDDISSAGGADSTGNAIGSINYSYSGTDVATYDPFAYILWYDADNCLFTFYIDFVSDATGASGTADYNFDYNGTTYSGTLPLNYYIGSGDDYVYYTIQGETFLAGSWDDLFASWLVAYFAEESPMSQEIASEINDIKLASNGLNPDGTVSADKTITIEGKGALNSNVMRTLANSDGVTVNYTYEYQGYRFMSTITSEGAAKIFSEDIAWYGPCFLANNFPTAMIGVVE